MSIRFQSDVSRLLVADGVTLATTGNKAFFTAIVRPFKIRAVAVAINAAPGDAGVLKFDKRPTVGSDTGRGDGDVAVLNLLTTHAAGNVIYKEGLDVLINPGQQVVAEMTDASAAVTAAVISMLVEEAHERPANLTNMKATT